MLFWLNYRVTTFLYTNETNNGEVVVALLEYTFSPLSPIHCFFICVLPHRWHCKDFTMIPLEICTIEFSSFCGVFGTVAVFIYNIDPQKTKTFVGTFRFLIRSLPYHFCCLFFFLLLLFSTLPVFFV